MADRPGKRTATSQDGPDLGKLIHAFEVTNKTLNKSPKTVAWYSNNLRLFRNFIQLRDSGMAIGNVGLQEAREYVLFLQERKRYQGHPFNPLREERLSPQTIRGHVETLRVFFSWLFDEGYIESNRLEKLRSPKVPKKYVDVLTQEEVQKILRSIDQGQATGLRSLAMVVILLDTGLRLSELVNLKHADAHVGGGYLKVMGKGSRERVVPIGAATQRVLLRYIHQARPEPAVAGVDNLFLAHTGRRLSVSGVGQMIRRLGQRCGVPRLHAHLCRHTFATNYLLNGGEVFSLQQILGHSSLDMVRRYVTLASAEVTVQHRKFSPMDRIGWSAKGQWPLSGPKAAAPGGGRRSPP